MTTSSISKAKKTLSPQAQVAKRIREYAKSLGIKCRASSSSFSMGDSVSWSVENVDPETFQKIESFANQHQYGRFDSMTDMYEHTNSRKDIPQTKYCFGKNNFTDDYYQAAWDLLRNRYSNGKDKPESFEKAKNMSFYDGSYSWGHDCISHQVHLILSGSCQEKELSELFWSTRKVSSPAKAKPQLKLVNNADAHIEEHQHTKHKFTMYIVISDRVSRDRFDELLTECRALNGWYSRKWGTTPGGFAFKSEASAQQFLSDHFSGDASPDKTEDKKEVSNTAAPAENKSNCIKTAEKLRKLAEGLQNTINAKFADRLTNTPKRVAQAMRARLDGEQLQRVQTVALRLADMHEAGEVPELLKPFTTKAALMPLMSSKKEPVANGYHTYHACTGEPSKNTPESAALWALLGEKSENDIKADEIRQAVQSVQFVKIPGYFPTPDKVIDLMLDYANLSSNDRVLEPSAGGGAICDRIKEYTTNIVAIEKNTSLANILDLKGFNPENINFLDRMPVGSFDKVLMNPPFENLQDIDHVMHAYKFLKHGGRLVAIMSPSGFFRSDKKSVGFRAWLSLVGGEVIELPEGSFKESGTGVNTNLVIIDKLSEYH